MRYALFMLAAVLLVRSSAPVPTAPEIDEQYSRDAAELQRAQVWAETFTEELLGRNANKAHGDW